MAAKTLKLWGFAVLAILQIVTSEDCDLKNNCRLVDINGDDSKPGHYKSIQSCVNEMESGDTCLIRSGNYHEMITVSGKNNIAIRGDLDFQKPVIDGTVEVKPNYQYDGDNDGVGDGQWRTEFKGGNKVCVGEIDIEDHPFQLFLRKDGEMEMLTVARWPNALWTDRDSETGTPLPFYNTYMAKSDDTSDRGTMVDRKVDGVSPLAESGLDMNGAMAVLNIGSWATFVKPVKSHKAGQDHFTYDDDFGQIKFKPSHNQYYLDSSEVLLDVPGEWYYDMQTKVLKFMPWDGECPDKDSGALRGRTMDRALEITQADGIIIADIDFFAANFIAHEGSKHDVINELYLDSINFRFPASSHRMLQDESAPKYAQILTGLDGTCSVTNCDFFGGEGPALHWECDSAKIHNNMFKWNNWSGQQANEKNGGLGTVFSKVKSPDKSDEFISNTLWYNGDAHGYKTGQSPKMIDNLVAGTCVGEIMHDGAGLQLPMGSGCHPVSVGNWVFDSPKWCIRYDTGDGELPDGYTGGDMFNNVCWGTKGYRVKGDFHNITQNLALVNWEENKEDPGLDIIHSLSWESRVENEHTILDKNAAWRANGGKYTPSAEQPKYKKGHGIWCLPGIKSNNYYGNNCYEPGDSWDGSWILDGKNVGAPEIDLPDLLMDVDNDDYRPKPDTVLTSTGVQIGPYPAAYSEATKYNIPGKKEYVASHPIPGHESTVKMKDALMFRPSFRCNDEGDKHAIYIAQSDNDFPADDLPSAELAGDDNIVAFSGIDVQISSGVQYKWRVDCVKAATLKQASQRRTGETWTFTMSK